MIRTEDDEYSPHVIILPSYCPVTICCTRHIAEDTAKACGYTNYRIAKATKRDLQCLLDGFFNVKEV